jgi:hypothetical protein
MAHALFWPAALSRHCQVRGAGVTWLTLPILSQAMTDTRATPNDIDEDPRSIYQEMKGDLQRVLSLPLEGQKELFREVLVGYLMEEHGYTEARARRLVTGNEAAILVMITEERADGLW